MTRSGVIRVIEVVRLEEIASTSVETIRGVDNHLLRVTQGVVQLRGEGVAVERTTIWHSDDTTTIGGLSPSRRFLSIALLAIRTLVSLGGRRRIARGATLASNRIHEQKHDHSSL